MPLNHMYVTTVKKCVKYNGCIYATLTGRLLTVVVSTKVSHIRSINYTNSVGNTKRVYKKKSVVEMVSTEVVST